MDRGGAVLERGRPAEWLARKRDELEAWLTAEEERLNGMPLDEPGLAAAQMKWQERLRSYERLCRRAMQAIAPAR
jgi:hypothetical protein